jgi:hypothetical protein
MNEPKSNIIRLMAPPRETLPFGGKLKFFYRELQLMHPQRG